MAKDDKDPGFFSTPIGWFAIFMMVMVAIGLFAYFMQRGNKNNNRVMNNRGNNYYRNMGQVPPSLAGYI